MLAVMLAISMLSTPTPPRWPADWQVALSRGPVPVLQDGRVITSPGSFIKWVIADSCVISLDADSAVVFSPGTGSACPRLHLISGTVRIAAPAEHPVELTWDGGSRTIMGVVTVSRLRGRVRFDGPALVEPAIFADGLLPVRPAWQLQTRIHQMLKESFSHTGDTVVQAAGGASMCLDSSGSAGDVGNNQTGITQLPPSSKLHIHVPDPRQVNR